MKRLSASIVISGLCFSVAVSASSQVEAPPPSSPAASIAMPEPCATDPTYADFEYVQRAAYDANPAARALLAANDEIEKTFSEVDRELRSRPNAESAKQDDDAAMKRIIQQILALKLPTCFESRMFYWMIQNYARDVDAARRRLHLPLHALPKYGSLPTDDANAYTYPATKTTGSVIAFNTVLFMFDYQMAKVTLPTIRITDSGSSTLSVDHSRATAIKAIHDQSDLPTNFTMAILEFLGMVPHETRPIAPQLDASLIEFTSAMELFAVAHEYGHVIKNHVSPLGQTRLATTTDKPTAAAVTATVVVRTWDQEFVADDIGFDLLAEVCRHAAESDEVAAARFSYKLHGGLFFLHCLQIIDDAKYVRDHGTFPPQLTLDEQVALRKLVDGSASAEERSRFQYLLAGDHPPAWLRIERQRARLQRYLSGRSLSPIATSFGDLAVGITDNLGLLWNMCESKLPILLEALKRSGDRATPTLPDEKAAATNSGGTLGRGSPGCRVADDAWFHTFLCDPLLQDAVALFRQAPTSDEAILASYQKAVTSDPLLLSGLQAAWAERQLSVSTARSDALAIIALTSERSAVARLRAVDDSAWSAGERGLRDQACAFIERHGHDTSIQSILKTEPRAFSVEQLLACPEGTKRRQPVCVDLQKLRFSSDGVAFLALNSSVSPARSLAVLALSFIASDVPDVKRLGTIADLLLEMKFLPEAQRYAQVGIERFPNDAALENTMGNVLDAQGQPSTAITHYARSLALGRVDGWPELNTAKSYDELNELDKAEEWYRRAIARRQTARSEAEYAGYLNDFAWFLATRRSADKSKTEEALRLAKRCLEIEETPNPNHIDTLAECFAASGDFASAAEAEAKALQYLPPTSADRPAYEARLKHFQDKSVR
jgi:tetratricopeptide (TPR) repeat protein